MVAATDLVLGTVILEGGDLLGSDATSPELVPTGVTPGSYTVAGVYADVKGRILYAKDLTELDLPCATVANCGLVKVGNNITLGAGSEISIPLATTSSKGVVIVGSGFVLDGCVIRVDYDIATDSALGLIIVPTSGYLDVDVSGNISVPWCTTSTVGVMEAGNGLAVASGVISVNESELDDATTIAKGVVQIGTNIDVTAGEISVAEGSAGDKGLVQVSDRIDVASGVISITDIATTGALGLIEVGANLGVDGNGELSRGNGDATYVSKGLVQIETSGNGLTIASGDLSLDVSAVGTFGGVSIGSGGNIDVTAGEISVPDGNVATKGAMKVPSATQLDLTTGTLTFTHSITTTVDLGSVIVPSASVITNSSGTIDVQDASTIQKGVVQVGTNLTVSSGVVNVDKAVGATTFGVIRSADTDSLTITAGEIDVGTNIPQLDEANAWTKSQCASLNTDTYTATWTPAFSDSNVHKMVLTGNVTINQPTNMIAGQCMTIILEQDATGSRTATFNGAFLFNGSETLTTDASAVDVVQIIVVDSSTMICQLEKDFK